MKRWLVFFAALAFPAPALACGASAGGAAGVSACSLPEHLEESRPKWRVGAGYALTSTALRFNGDTRLDETRHVAFANLDYLATPAWTFELVVGSILGGGLQSPTSDFKFSPGLLIAGGAAWRVLEASAAQPFVLVTAQLAFVTASTKESNSAADSVRYTAIDGRVGASAGWPILQAFTPYLFARAFGGPVLWELGGSSQTGTDVHHYQIGAGLLFRVARTVDVFAEGAPLGERVASMGAGFVF
jgi:hypothetical protein